MKKLILVLAIALIASPALAALDVSLVRVGDDVEVQYSGADSNNLPRAFALRITVAGTAQISGISGYIEGESTTGNIGYGIYPATISIDSAGNVDSNGTPLAAPGDPGVVDQVLPSSNVVLEFASLYYGAGNKPNTSGTLCVLAFDPNSASNPLITMVGEDIFRISNGVAKAGVVLEDGSTVAVDANLIYTTAVPPSPATSPVPANAATKVYKYTDLSWTAGDGATSHDVYFGTANPPPFKQNQAGTTYDTGTMAINTVYYCKVIEKNDAGESDPLTWSFTVECFPGLSTDAKYVQWSIVDKPDCWCAVINPRQCHGDADGKSETKSNFWAASNDLTILSAAWNKNYATIAGQTAGTYNTPLICADFTHTAETKSNFRAASLDLTALSASWNKANKPDPNCALLGY